MVFLDQYLKRNSRRLLFPYASINSICLFSRGNFRPMLLSYSYSADNHLVYSINGPRTSPIFPPSETSWLPPSFYFIIELYQTESINIFPWLFKFNTIVTVTVCHDWPRGLMSMSERKEERRWAGETKEPFRFRFLSLPFSVLSFLSRFLFRTIRKIMPATVLLLPPVRLRWQSVSNASSYLSCELPYFLLLPRARVVRTEKLQAWTYISRTHDAMKISSRCTFGW